MHSLFGTKHLIILAVYIAHYAFTVLFCVTACYIKPIIHAIRSKKVAA